MLSCSKYEFDVGAAVNADPCLPPWDALPALPLTAHPPESRSWVKAAWDAAELHFFFYLHPFPERGSVTGGEETLRVFIDSAGDGESYFEVGISPLHAVHEAVFRRVRSGYRKNAAWHCEGLRTAVHPQAEGWFAELAIPFAGLGAIGPEGCWRVCFHHGARAGLEWDTCVFS